eukprot:5597169-Pyramimonas_sp.AAC.1
MPGIGCILCMDKRAYLDIAGRPLQFPIVLALFSLYALRLYPTPLHLYQQPTTLSYSILLYPTLSYSILCSRSKDAGAWLSSREPSIFPKNPFNGKLSPQMF